MKKNDRLQIYEIALEHWGVELDEDFLKSVAKNGCTNEFDDRRYNYTLDGFCTYFDKVHGLEFDKDNFPELWKQGQVDLFVHYLDENGSHAYGFSETGREQRVDALRVAISELTEICNLKNHSNMNTRELMMRIKSGMPFDYSLSFGDMEGISLNKEELMFRYADSEKDLESFLRFASKTLNLDDLIISGEMTDLGYKLSISESVVRPMSASEWIDLKFGPGRSHGTAQVKMMDDYAEYFHNIKVGKHEK